MQLCSSPAAQYKHAAVLCTTALIACPPTKAIPSCQCGLHSVEGLTSESCTGLDTNQGAEGTGYELQTRNEDLKLRASGKRSRSSDVNWRG